MRISLIKDVKVPSRGTLGSAGIDFYIPNDYKGSTFISPGESIFIASGVRAQVPKGYMLTAFNKSGIAKNKSLLVGACVVDEDYQGEIHIHLINCGDKSINISAGDKITQFILVPVLLDCVEVVDNSDLFFDNTERGAGAFGSTGQI